MGSLVFPICLLLAYNVVLGEQVHKVTGVESVYGLVPVSPCCPRCSAP